jgi:elongation factor Ts
MATDKFADINRLRDVTGAGVMECKKVLAETNGDFDAAVAIIRERGLVKVEKRADRQTGAGLVFTYVHNDRIGVMVEARAETDFVVRSDAFRAFVKEVAMHIAAAEPEDVEALLKQPYVRDESRTVNDLLTELIGRVGENVQIARFARFAA